MSTNSSITVRINQEERHQIYCHWDGYPSSVGMILAKFYNNYEDAARLVSLGDLSSLGSKIEPSEDSVHSFESPQENVCVYYGRDRGETDVEKRILRNSQSSEKQEYNYIFKNGLWFCNAKPMVYVPNIDKLLVGEDLIENEFDI